MLVLLGAARRCDLHGGVRGVRELSKSERDENDRPTRPDHQDAGVREETTAIGLLPCCNRVRTKYFVGEDVSGADDGSRRILYRARYPYGVYHGSGTVRDACSTMVTLPDSVKCAKSPCLVARTDS